MKNFIHQFVDGNVGLGDNENANFYESLTEEANSSEEEEEEREEEEDEDYGDYEDNSDSQNYYNYGTEY